MFHSLQIRIYLAALFSTLLIALPVSAADYEREQRLSDQIVDAIMDGEAVDLEAAGRSFLGIHMQSDAEQIKGGVILLHGRGLHPNWESVVQPLRITLPENGWHTLSIQMPVLHKQAKYYDYLPLLPEAQPRIEAAITYLKQQGVENIVLIAHSCGAHMAMHRVRQQGEKGLAAYVGIGMGATDYKQKMPHPFPLEKMSIPVFDIYAENDFPAVLRMAPDRLAMIKKAGNPQSAQLQIPGAEHYFEGYDDELVEAISHWLNGLKL